MRQPRGRGQAAGPGRTAGFCPNCGDRFDFTAKLKAGDLVAGQYDVAGALAHGGMGWIYLARDRNVSGRWCVLKGLLDTADPDAAEAPWPSSGSWPRCATRPSWASTTSCSTRARATSSWSTWAGPASSSSPSAAARPARGRCRWTEAAAYLAVLPAIGYLHDRGLIYCDFKPDNVIHEDGAVKLIDLGGVRRWDDTDAAIFGTIGYQAPRCRRPGRPSPATSTRWGGPWRCWSSLAGLDDDRRRAPARPRRTRSWSSTTACGGSSSGRAPDPAERFRDADEMADALHGVLCQVAAAVDDIPRPHEHAGTARRAPPRRHRLAGAAQPAHAQPPRIANRVAASPRAIPRPWPAWCGSTRS